MGDDVIDGVGGCVEDGDNEGDGVDVGDDVGEADDVADDDGELGGEGDGDARPNSAKPPSPGMYTVPSGPTIGELDKPTDPSALQRLAPVSGSRYTRIPG